ncbi:MULTISPECIES: RraA family protein [Clostridioides]|uniref:RraA family protein n=1 Tax=Clostridioides sp. ZZV14-6387 TaxID=2811497 RepID=UPI0006BBD2B9|nr:dimethylmenaquinone methyltransferase [Clostridioides difficile]MCC0691001.1 RraA family protein [Clostridioides sp. ZZV14-6387]MCI9977369.1 RraA family protein [Clostridioides difficile]NJJ36325.1 RraA family protein [Clostridioides difficile]NJK12641.1 RraA family protein [Clostridioides difficile]
MTIGNRVYLKRDLPDKELVKRFSVLPAANVGDCMYRSSALSSEIKLMSSPQNKMCGVALTVKSRPGDNLMLHQALNIAQEGDIIILSNNGDRTQAIMGEIMYKYLADFKKVAGIVIDGPIRDIDVISKSNCPIYATGTTPGGPYKEGPGEVNVPISIGGIAVNPGDIILGDQDGVIVIPKNDAVDLIEKAEANAQQDHAKVLNASEGTANRDWVKETLEKKGVEIIDDVYRA